MARSELRRQQKGHRFAYDSDSTGILTNRVGDYIGKGM
jgi:hypothetical protein